MKQHYAYKYRLYPNQEQEKQLAKDFWCTRFVYNYYLNKSIQDYKQNNNSKWNKFEYVKDLVNLKKEEQTKRLKESNSQILQQSLLNLDIAYNKFFKWQSKFPNFKKRNSKNSISIPQHFTILNNKIKIPKYKEMIKYKQDRKLEWDAKSLTISRDSDWKYYVSILVEKEIEYLFKTWKEVGIDLGLKDLAVTSDWGKFKKHKNKNINKIKKMQRLQSKKQKQSRRYKLLKTKIAKLHKADANRRSNYNHNLSIKLVREYDLIGMENLNIKWMMQNHCLAWAIGIQWRYDLITKIKYKSEWYGKTFHQVNRRYPTSKQCNQCWNLKKDLSLSDRVYNCSCWYTDDRDVNAAKNILSYTKLELKF